MDIESYIQGLQDGIDEIDAELACVDIEYADSPCKTTAFRVLTNAKLLLQDKIDQAKKG